MITDIRKLKPGDVLITETNISPPFISLKHFSTNNIVSIDKGECIVLINSYEKIIGSLICVFFDVLYQSKIYKIYVLEYRNISLPKDMIGALYVTKRFSKLSYL